MWLKATAKNPENKQFKIKKDNSNNKTKTKNTAKTAATKHSQKQTNKQSVRIDNRYVFVLFHFLYCKVPVHSALESTATSFISNSTIMSAVSENSSTIFNNSCSSLFTRRTPDSYLSVSFLMAGIFLARFGKSMSLGHDQPSFC